MKGRFPDIKSILLGVAAASGVTLFVGGQAYAAKTTDISSNGTQITVLGGGDGLSAKVYKTEVVDETESSSTAIISQSDRSAAGSVGQKLPPSDLETADTGAVTIVDGDSKLVAAKAGENIENGESALSAEAVPTGAEEKAEGVFLATVGVRPAASAEPLADERMPVRNGLVGVTGAGGRSMKLRLQPIITNSPVMIKDLATALPTAPTRKHDVPQDPDGLLSQLTMTMSAVVPAMTEAQQALAWPGGISAAQEEATVIGSLIILLVISFFAAWLRRTGFVGAARSDVAALMESLVALIRRDYDLVKGHSPFLVMLEGKGFINVVNG